MRQRRCRAVGPGALSAADEGRFAVRTTCGHVLRQPARYPGSPLRSIQRDVAVRGRDVGGVIEQYTRFVKPAFDQFVAPSRKYADIIIPWQRCDEA